jgi:hypothetical protein
VYGVQIERENTFFSDFKKIYNPRHTPTLFGVSKALSYFDVGKNLVNNIYFGVEKSIIVRNGMRTIQQDVKIS